MTDWRSASADKVISRNIDEYLADLSRPRRPPRRLADPYQAFAKAAGGPLGSMLVDLPASVRRLSSGLERAGNITARHSSLPLRWPLGATPGHDKAFLSLADLGEIVAF